MNYLIIDTSGVKNFITLVYEGEETTLPLPSKELTRTIHLSLATLLEGKKDLNFIAVCRGPGFFTGVRIGVTIAKTLSYTLHLPLISFHSLELIEAAADEAKVLDARGGKVYISYGDEPPFLSTIDTLSQKIPTQYKKLIASDIENLFIDAYPLSAKLPSPRRLERAWIEKVQRGEVENYLSFKIDYQHPVEKY